MTNRFPIKRLLSLALALLMLLVALPVLAEDGSISADAMTACFFASENEGKYWCYNNGSSAVLTLRYFPSYTVEKITVNLSNDDGIAWQTSIDKFNIRPKGVQPETFTVNGNGLKSDLYTLSVSVAYFTEGTWSVSPFMDQHIFNVRQAPVAVDPEPVVEPVKVESFTLKLGKTTIAGKTIELKAGKRVTVRATDFKPADAENTTLKWSSSNTRVAVVSPKGKVVARKAGICKIVARTTDGSRIARSFILKVVD